jgi:hypothetical protein
MISADLYSRFSPYLDPTREYLEIPTSKIGLIKDAPPDAVEAYEKYKKIQKGNIGTNIEL